MSHVPTAADRFRLRRLVWTFDTLIGDLPGRRRREIRRELRENVYAAAAEVGMREAIRRLGNLRLLAAEYIDADLGAAPRTSWVKGAVWAGVTEFLYMVILMVGPTAFMDGVDATNPPAGVYTWAPMGGWIARYDVTFDSDGFSGFTLDLRQGLVTLLALSFSAFFLGGRMWRAIPPWSRGRPHTSAT